MNDSTEDASSKESNLYEDRLLAYVDILGWKAAHDESSHVLLDALQSIHGLAARYSDAFKKNFSELNPMYQRVEVGAFSDNVIISMPASFGARILDKTADLCLKILEKGFLTRGGVVRGNVFHRDGLVFGPGLLEAVKLESSEAIYPRILIGQGVLAACGSEHMDLSNFVVKDFLEREVLNPFCISETAILGPAIIKTSFDDQLQKISAIVNQRMVKLGLSSKEREKWAYFQKTFLSRKRV